MLSVLATFMGHDNPLSTQVYLQSTMELRREAIHRFQRAYGEHMSAGGGHEDEDLTTRLRDTCTRSSRSTSPASATSALTRSSPIGTRSSFSCASLQIIMASRWTRWRSRMWTWRRCWHSFVTLRSTQKQRVDPQCAFGRSPRFLPPRSRARSWKPPSLPARARCSSEARSHTETRYLEREEVEALLGQVDRSRQGAS